MRRDESPPAGRSTGTVVVIVAVMAAVTGALGACLPAGQPPVGQHVLAGRAWTGTYFSPSESAAAPAYLLASGPLRSPGLAAPLADEVVADVYLVPVGAAPAAPAGLGDLVPVVTAMEIPGADPTSHTIATDSSGRLVYLALATDSPPSAAPFSLCRRDLGLGLAETLAGAHPDGPLFENADARLGLRPFLLAPGRTRLYAGDAQEGRLWAASAAQVVYQPGDAAFVGNDFLVVGTLVPPDPNLVVPTHELLRMKPDAAPEVLLSTTAALGFAPILGATVPQLMLTLGTATGAAPFALLDTMTLVSVSLPAAKGYADFVSASPDGELLLFRTSLTPLAPTSPVSYRLFIYDAFTKAYAFVDGTAVGKDIGALAEWRPGGSELWFQTLPDGFGTWSADAGTKFHAGTLASYDRPRAGASVFTADGRHWFGSVDGTPPALYVGSAAAPDAPALRLNPPGTQTTRHWETADGRLVVEAWTGDARRSDIYLVDANAGVVRPLGSVGFVREVGTTRALALLDWQLTRASGQLALLELETGVHTVLAEDVYAVDVDRGPSLVAPVAADPLAPGTRVAFLTRNRLEAPDDGLWVAVLP